MHGLLIQESVKYKYINKEVVWRACAMQRKADGRAVHGHTMQCESKGTA